MADWLIFGIDGDLIVIWAQIGVAFGTIALAYVTYLTVINSKETLDSLKNQIDIAQKEFENKQIELEKPQIIDQLQEIINPLSEEINQELNQIDEKSLLWKSRGYRGDSLFFQLKPSSDFYTDTDINTRFGIIIYEINTVFPVFKELCQKRYILYLSLSDLFKKIHNEYKVTLIDEKIVQLIQKNNPPLEQYDYENDYTYYTVRISEYEDGIPIDDEDFPVEEFKQSIIDICLSELLSQRIIPHNKYEKMIVSEYSSYEKELKILLNNQSFDENSRSFHSIIEQLRLIDTTLKNEILKIKMEYREKYHLNDKEYWAIFKNTS